MEMALAACLFMVSDLLMNRASDCAEKKHVAVLLEVERRGVCCYFVKGKMMLMMVAVVMMVVMMTTMMMMMMVVVVVVAAMMIIEDISGVHSRVSSGLNFKILSLTRFVQKACYIDGQDTDVFGIPILSSHLYEISSPALEVVR